MKPAANSAGFRAPSCEAPPAPREDPNRSVLWTRLAGFDGVLSQEAQSLPRIEAPPPETASLRIGAPPEAEAAGDEEASEGAARRAAERPG